MTATIKKLESLIESGYKYLDEAPEFKLAEKPSPEKWSKKEILGHLIDSAINNLQRFTEIQFETRPYKIRKYNQDGLVKANAYQDSETKLIINFWLSANTRIADVMRLQTKDTLSYEIIIGDNTSSDLKFLMEDYVNHLEHHLKQIMA